MCQFSTVCGSNKSPAPKGSLGRECTTLFARCAGHLQRCNGRSPSGPTCPPEADTGPGGSGASSGFLCRRLSPLHRLSGTGRKRPTTPLRSLYVLCAIQYIGQARRLSTWPNDATGTEPRRYGNGKRGQTESYSFRRYEAGGSSSPKRRRTWCEMGGVGGGAVRRSRTACPPKAEPRVAPVDAAPCRIDSCRHVAASRRPPLSRTDRHDCARPPGL